MFREGWRKDTKQLFYHSSMKLKTPFQWKSLRIQSTMKGAHSDIFLNFRFFVINENKCFLILEGIPITLIFIALRVYLFMKKKETWQLTRRPHCSICFNLAFDLLNKKGRSWKEVIRIFYILFTQWYTKQYQVYYILFALVSL